MEDTTPLLSSTAVNWFLRAMLPESQGGGGGIVCAKDLSLLLNNLANIDGNATPQVDKFVLGGVLTNLSRQGRVTVVNVYSYASNGEDEFNEVEIVEAKDNDVFIIRQRYTSQNITVKFSTGVNVKGQTADYRIGMDGGYIALIYNASDGLLHKAWTQNQIADSLDMLSLESEEVTIFSGIANVTKSYIRLQSERTASTASTATWQVTAVGTNATVILYYDGGDGQIMLGYKKWTGSPTMPTMIADLAAEINARTAINGQATATDDGVDTLTVSFPANMGAYPNGFLFYQEVAGGVTANVDATFAGGIDGVDQDDTLDTITGWSPGTFGIIKNIMPANTITLSNAGNIQGNGDVLLGGQSAIFFMTAIGDVIKLTGCCRPSKATSYVDQLGPTNPLRGWQNKPFTTIRAALLASQIYDDINILATGNGSEYNERDLFYLSNIGYKFSNGAYILYTGSSPGGLFDDSATGSNGAMEGIVMVFDAPGDVEAYGLGKYIQNNGSSGGGDVGVFKITDSVTHVIVNGGRFLGKDYTVKVDDGIIEICNAQIWTNNISGAYGIDISNGVCRLKNCTIISQSNSIPIRRTGGTLILEDCFIYNPWNDAAGHGIVDTAAATTGKIVFIGTNRIVTTHASSNAINTTNAQNVKKMGLIYTRYANSGTLNDLITGAGLTVVTDGDVE